MKWSVGVTTVPERFERHLLPTLASLKRAGFDAPRLFVDGPVDPRHESLGLPTVFRGSKVRAFGNWIMALWELWIREPTADRFAIFQDDLEAVSNLRQYVEACFPTRHFEKADSEGVVRDEVEDSLGQRYLNCFTFWNNERIAEAKRNEPGWHESKIIQSHDVGEAMPDRFQTGQGAVGLIFGRWGVMTVLSSLSHVVERPLDPIWGHRKLDGGVVSAINKAGGRELIHVPSLLQHAGLESAIGSCNDGQPKARTFPGEGFDALGLLKK